MMLSFLSILGISDIFQMHALTSLSSLCVNGVAANLVHIDENGGLALRAPDGDRCGCGRLRGGRPGKADRPDCGPPVRDRRRLWGINISSCSPLLKRQIVPTA